MNSHPANAQPPLSPLSFSLRRALHLLLIIPGIVLVLAAVAFGSLCWSLHSVVSTFRLPLSQAQLGVLRGSPYRGHFAARLHEDIGDDHVLHQLPRYQAIFLIGAFFMVSRDDYAQVVAHRVPFMHTGLARHGRGLTEFGRVVAGVPGEQLSPELITDILNRSASPRPSRSSTKPAMDERWPAIRD